MLRSCVLVAIVKNEFTNLAGGVEAYITRLLSLVGLAVVCDTGSSDATLDCLRRVASTHERQLHVFADEQFESFAAARNRSLDHAFDVLQALPSEERFEVFFFFGCRFRVCLVHKRTYAHCSPGINFHTFS